MKSLIVYLLLMIWTPALVRAEFFIDAFGGMAHTHSGSFDVYREDNGSGSYDGGELNGSTNPMFGLRGGYWLKHSKWLGIALDFSHFTADSRQGAAEVAFSSLSPMLMLRYPMLLSDEYPDGRFYPYAGAGVSLVFAEISSPYVDVPDSSELDDESGSGTVFCAGATWLFSRKIGLFLEYRLVSVSFDQSREWQTGAFFWPRYDHIYHAEGDARTQQLLGGITVRF
jgi:opacity protein-like surface antigen